MTTTTNSPAVPALWTNRNFVLLWASGVIASLGDRIHYLVMLEILAIQLRQHKHWETQDASQLTIVMLAPFLLGPLFGTLADRLPRRGLMLFADLLRVGIIIVSRTLLLSFGPDFLMAPALGTAIPWGYVILFGAEIIVALSAALFSPSKMALLPALVHPTQLVQANALTAAAGTVASLMGFVVGAWLVGNHLHLAMYINAGTFFVSALCLFAMRIPPALATINPNPTSAWQDFRLGFHYVRTHRRTGQIITLMFLFWAMATFILNGLVGIVTNPLFMGMANEWVGYFQGIAGVGMIVGAGLVSLARNNVPKEVGIGLAMACSGLFLLGFALSVNVWFVALGFLIVGAMWGSILMVTLETLLQRTTPDYMRGRVNGVKDIVTTTGLISAAIPLAFFENMDPLMVKLMIGFSSLVVVVGLISIINYIRSDPFPVRLAIARRFATVVMTLLHRYQRVGPCRIPTTGAVIVVANHTAGLDPVTLIISSPRRSIRFMMAKEVYVKPWFKWIGDLFGIIPVDRARADVSSLREAMRSLQRGDVIGIFPEGGISMDHQLLPPRPGAAILAARTGATVVPAYITGTHKHESLLRDFFRPAKISVRYGKPLKFSEFHPDPTNRQAVTDWGYHIMDAIAKLGGVTAPPKPDPSTPAEAIAPVDAPQQ